MVSKMKKFALLIALVLVVSLFSACGSEIDVADTTQAVPETTEEQLVRVSVSKSVLEDSEAFIKSMKKYGAEVNDINGADGYLFVFSKTEHKKLLEDKFNETVKKFAEYEDDENHYIDNIEYDEDFRNMTFYVDREIYDSTGSTTGNIVVASSALSYQIYLEDGQKTNVKVVYSDNEEVVTTFFLPMNLSVEQ